MNGMDTHTPDKSKPEILPKVQIRPRQLQKQTECGKLFRDVMGMINFQCGLCSQEFEFIAEFAMHLADDHPILAVNIPNYPEAMMKPNYESETAIIPPDNIDSIVIVDSTALEVPAKQITKSSRHNHRKCVKRSKRENKKYCHICKDPFSASELRIHLAELGPTTPPSQFECTEPTCNMIFQAKCKLRKHVLHNHSDKIKKHKCHLCERRFKKADALLRHVNAHDGIKPFECNECGKCFSSRTYIYGHLRRMHSDEMSKWQCWYCGERFYASSFMNFHIQTKHFPDKSKTFQCDKCEKSFCTRHTMKLHYRSHTGERPYSCELCGKTFPQNNTFQRHMKSAHINARSFKCSHCPKTFNLKSTVRQHEKQVHERRMKLEIEKLRENI